jgi:hypothetical protein
MITRLKLKPGQRGTKALLEEYGDALVCVRYRYNAESRTRIKTVELIVETKQLPAAKRIIKDSDIVLVQIAYGQRDLGRQIRTLGGTWDPAIKLWSVPYGKIKGTELEKHILLDASPKSAVNSKASNNR